MLKLFNFNFLILFLLLFFASSAKSQCISSQWDPSYTWVKDCNSSPYDGLFPSGTGITTYTSTATIMAGATPHTLSYKLHYFKASLTGALTPSKMVFIVGLHPWSDGQTVPNLLNIESSLMGYEGGWEDVIFMTVALENGNNLNTWWDGSKVAGVPTTWAMNGIVQLVKDRMADATTILTAAGATGISTRTIDSNRVYLVGTSMGGSGAYHIGVRHPEIFAAIHSNAGFADYEGGPCGIEAFCTSFNNDFIGTVGENLQMKGLDNVDYNARNYSNMSWFVGTHNGVSWTNSVGAGRAYEPPYINITHGSSDANVDIGSVDRLVTALNTKKYGYSYNRHTGGHSAQNFLNIHWLLGFKKNQSFLAFSSNSTDITTGSQYYNNLSRVYWQPSTIVDQTGTYAVKIFTNTGTATVSVTPRRLQNFTVSANKAYHYWVGTVSGGGTAVSATAGGILTIPSITATTAGATLTITADTPTPSPLPVIQYSPTTHAFGNVQLTTNTSQTLTITNGGNTSLSVTGAAITGAQAAQFEVTAILPMTLAAGASGTMSVKYTPSDLNNAAGILTLTSNDPVSGTVDIALTGKGVTSVNAGVPNFPATASQIAVSTVAGLVSALSTATKGQTIMLADGTYNLTVVHPLRLRTDSIGIYGASKDPTKVILTGGGFGSGDTDEELIKIEAVGNFLAYFTLRDGRANGVKIQSGGNHNFIAHNLYFIDICERSFKAPAVPISNNGIIRYCLFEQVTPITSDIPNLNDDGNYIGGLDMMKCENWRIHDNTFKNIRGMTGGARGAVFLWNGCKKNRVERNLFIGNDRAIALGNTLNDSVGNDSGYVRNNVILAGSGISLEIVNTQGTEISYNSIYSANTGYYRTLMFANNGTNILKNNTIMGKPYFVSGTVPDTSRNLWITDIGVSGPVPDFTSDTVINTIVVTDTVRTDSIIARNSALNDFGTTALFKFDEGTGSQTYDTKNKITGALNNVTWTQNNNGYAATFNGTSSYISTNSSLILTLRDTFTVDIIFKLPTTAVRRLLFGMRQSGSFGGEVGSDGKVHIDLQSGGYFSQLAGSTRVDNDAWHTISIINKYPGTSLYIDGSKVDTVTNTNLRVVNNNDMIFGNLHIPEFRNQFWFSGSIDLIRFSRVVRTPQEINDIKTIADGN